MTTPMIDPRPEAVLTVDDRYDRVTQERYRAAGWWRDDAFAEIVEGWATRTPDRRAVTDGEAELTYAQLVGQAYRLGGRLRALGVCPGDRVAVQLPNWVELAVVYLALARIGAIMVPIMMVNRKAEIRHVLAQSGAVAAVTAAEFRGFDHATMFRELRAEAPAVATLVVVRAEVQPGAVAQPNEHGFDELAEPAAGNDLASVEALGPFPDADAGHVIVFTSGTESKAKGCFHTWNTYGFSARGLGRDVFEVTESDTVFMPTPATHATGLLVGVTMPLLFGAATHLVPKWEPADGLRRIEQFRCTISATATAFVRGSIEASRTEPRDVSSIRFWLCAGAPIPRSLASEFGEVFGGRLIPLYGCSELLAVTSCHLNDPIEKVASSDGRPALDGVEVAVTGPDGRSAGVGEEGEILYTGPGAILGYWRDPERTAASIDAQGRHHTGDLGRLDKDGYLRVTGRLKEIIIRGGSNISAAEIESYVLAHPLVRAAAVVGYPDERLGEKVCAFVVPVEGAQPTLTEITDHMRHEQQIAVYKLPERLVLVDELPMTATGKVQKFQLRAKHAAQP